MINRAFSGKADKIALQFIRMDFIIFGRGLDGPTLKSAVTTLLKVGEIPHRDTPLRRRPLKTTVGKMQLF
jgi:hypothetical protein